MDQLLGQTRLRLVDVLTLGRERDLVVVDDRDPHAWCIALDFPYHGRALKDQRAAGNVGWRKDKQIWRPGGGVSFIAKSGPSLINLTSASSTPSISSRAAVTDARV